MLGLTALTERLRQAAPYLDAGDARDVLALCAEHEALAAENAKLKEEWGVRFPGPDGAELDFPSRERAATVAAQHSGQLVTRKATDWAAVGE